MAIVPLVRVTLYGPAAEKDAVLDGLQRLGCVHLEDLRAAAGEAPPVPPAISDARTAWRYLEDSPVRRPALRHATDVDLAAIAKEALAGRERAHALAEERLQLRRRIAELEPWGDFALPAWARDGATRFWFHVVPLHRLQHLEELDHAWHLVARDHRFAYVVVVSEAEPVAMPGTPVTLDARPLSELRARLEQVEREIEEIEYRRIGLTLYRDLLADWLDEADDRAARERAALLTLERTKLFAVRGWVARARTAELRRFAAEHRLALTVAEPAPGDAPPTLLENPAALRGGEALVTFYKTPAYSLWDPSIAVFCGFALFFGIIISDAGYALIAGVALLAFWRRLGSSPDGVATRGVLLALVISSTVYGVLIGSYFGEIPSHDSWLGRLHLLDAEDQGLMMLLAIGVGAVHLTLANLVNAWGARRSLTALHSVGWACIILGGFVAGVGKTRGAPAALFPGGLAALGFGALLVLLFTSEQPPSLAPRALVARLVDGLKGLAEVSKAFGDVLSYLRLFALGLAAIKLAEAFNSLAGSARELPGVGVALAVLILLAGHGINFAMGILGGVVHGLRLNVIEFFNWSLHEEGEQFRAFTRKARD